MSVGSESDVDRLGDTIAELAARIDAATYQLLVLIGQFDACAGWNTGFHSCAHPPPPRLWASRRSFSEGGWLNWRTGIELGAAREKVRVARALANLPVVSAAMRRGELSYSKVRATTRVATPENERRLVEAARCSTAAQVERLVRAWRRVDRMEAAREARRQHQHRQLDTWVDDDGMLIIRGPADARGAGIVAARPGGGAGRRAPGRRRHRGTAGDRYHVVIHVDEQALMVDSDGGQARSRIPPALCERAAS